jgi:hypothetical protein
MMTMILVLPLMISRDRETANKWSRDIEIGATETGGWAREIGHWIHMHTSS